MKRLMMLICALVMLAQAGCGGGGLSSADVTTVAGTASKGIIKNGTVRIYALNADGSRGTLLAETSTDDKGKYSKTFNYNGPIIAYAFGSYTDEATGTAVTLAESEALRAALPSAKGAVTLPITALTELAVRKAGAALTPAAISDANALVSSIFDVDITGTEPVEATAAAMGDSAVKPQQLDYTLALAALSQMAKDSSGANANAKLQSALSTLSDEITTTIAAPTAQKFAAAVNSYLENNIPINALICNRGGSPIIGVGNKRAVITISLTGAGNNLYGANCILNLPTGVTITPKSDGTAYNGVIGLSSSTTGALLTDKFTPATANSGATLAIGLASTAAIGNGTFVVINANVGPKISLSKGSFSLSGGSFTDQNGVPLTSPSLAISELTVK